MQPLRIDMARAPLSENYVLLLTTNSVERRAMDTAFGKSLRARTPFENAGCTLGEIGGQFVLHLTGTSGSGKPKSIDRMVRSLLADRFMPRPSFVLLAGVGWGVPAKVAEGDIVLAGEIVSVNETRRTERKTIYKDTLHPSPLLGEAEGLGPHLEGLAEGFRVHAGRLASAPTHFGDDDARDELLAQVPSILGGEMEAFNLVPDLALPWLVLRAISDFGEDSVTRAYQDRAAANAAQLIAPLLGELERRAVLEPRRADELTAGLVATIAGRSLEIDRPDDNLDLATYLDARFSPTLAYRLSRYMVAAGDDASLADELTDLLLEKAQNAFVHGGARRVTIDFNDLSVDYADDGAVYDLLSLKGNRGGAVALRDFQADFVFPGLASIQSRKAKAPYSNRYRFEFIALSTALQAARQNCELSINDTAVLLQEPFERQVRYADGCETLFYDTTKVRMTSIHADTAPVFRELLAQGKSLFLLVRAARNKRFYENELADYAGDKLTIVVAPR
ncbi:hypothetical protein [Caulobacter endophyticus]|uniref:hypothetical protein n=1 Tax=Caulobacter endophyticus TaxID=2172652 RepID=UPI0024104C3D|nr:hypothetical protein [Caulobacter endophyticus]MDG2531273.1 hypothetical protein [Caulobacter endophyticus]